MLKSLKLRAGLAHESDALERASASQAQAIRVDFSMVSSGKHHAEGFLRASNALEIRSNSRLYTSYKN